MAKKIISKSAPAAPTAAALAAQAANKKLVERAESIGLSRSTKPDVYTRLQPSRAISTCSGHDIVKRSSHRKAKYLFIFPGRLESLARGGIIGELGALDTVNPTLLINFPSGSLKLTGAFVTTRHRFLTLQCNPKAARVLAEGGSAAAAASAGGAAAITAEDVFSRVVLFSSAQWVGTDGEPVQAPPMPQQTASQSDFAFNTGAGRHPSIAPRLAKRPADGVGVGAGVSTGAGVGASTGGELDGPRARRAATHGVRYREVESGDEAADEEDDDDDGILDEESGVEEIVKRAPVMTAAAPEAKKQTASFLQRMLLGGGDSEKGGRNLKRKRDDDDDDADVEIVERKVKKPAPRARKPSVSRAAADDGTSDDDGDDDGDDEDETDVPKPVRKPCVRKPSRAKETEVISISSGTEDAVPPKKVTAKSAARPSAALKKKATPAVQKKTAAKRKPTKNGSDDDDSSSTAADSDSDY